MIPYTLSPYTSLISVSLGASCSTNGQQGLYGFYEGPETMECDEYGCTGYRNLWARGATCSY